MTDGDINMDDSSTSDLEEFEQEENKDPTSNDLSSTAHESDNLSSSTTTTKFNDSLVDHESATLPDENPIVVALTDKLDALCLQAREQNLLLPHKTRIALTKQTRTIFQSYAQHGSQQRLASALERFLLAKDTGLDLTPIPPLASPRSRTTRSIDPDSGDLIRHLPFHPTDLHLCIPGNVSIPTFLLPSLSRILSLHAAEARALLKHHCTKYGDSPLFRAGIRELIASRVESIVDSTSEDPLGLSPETRSFFRHVYERFPGKLNIAEQRMMCRAARVGLETVELFWEDMSEQRKTWEAMRGFVLARELELLREEKIRVAEMNREKEAHRNMMNTNGMDNGGGNPMVTSSSQFPPSGTVFGIRR